MTVRDLFKQKRAKDAKVIDSWCLRTLMMNQLADPNRKRWEMIIEDLLALLESTGHEPLVLRGDDEDKRVVVAPSLMGRVMAAGFEGERGETDAFVFEQQIRDGFSHEGKGTWNNFGGAERVWFGPDGGPFGTFFPPGAPQTYQHMRFQPALNRAEYRIVERGSSGKRVVLGADIELANHAGQRFRLEVRREVEVLESCPFVVDPEDRVESVGFESRTTAKNVGTEPITRRTGPVTIWTVGQFDCRDHSVVMIPIRKGPASELGEPVCMEYTRHVTPGGVVPDRFMSVGEDRVLIGANGRAQIKLDVWKRRCLGRLGAIDLERNAMTIVDFDFHPHKDYAATYWLPYDGDPYDGAPISVMVVAGDAQNTGSLPFHELESFSPALFPGPGESFGHVNRTFHLRGDREAIAKVCRRHFHVDLESLVEFDRRAR